MSSRRGSLKIVVLATQATDGERKLWTVSELAEHMGRYVLSLKQCVDNDMLFEAQAYLLLVEACCSNIKDALREEAQ